MSEQRRTDHVLGREVVVVRDQGLEVTREFLNGVIGKPKQSSYVLSAELINELHRVLNADAWPREELAPAKPAPNSLSSLVRSLRLDAFADEAEPNGLACGVCGEPQMETPSGATCPNGHGGAQGLEAEDEPSSESSFEVDPFGGEEKPLTELSDAEYGAYLRSLYSSRYLGPDPDKIGLWKTDGHVMSQDQVDAVTAFIKGTGQVYCLTGPAGSGKSAVVNFLRQHYGSLAVTATTGKAAMNVDGCTIDTFASMKRPNKQEDDQLTRPQYDFRNPRTMVQNFQGLRYLVNDESSMIGLEMGNFLYRHVFSKHPLLKVLLVGDWAQAAPVDDGWAMGGELLGNATWLRLTVIHRQSDPAFLKALNEVREGRVSDEAQALFRSRVQRQPPEDDSYIRMYATNRRAGDYNRKRLGDHCRQAGYSQFELTTAFQDRRSARMQEKYPRADGFIRRKIEDSRMAHRELFAVGAKVVFTFNDPGELGMYINGDTATILDAWDAQGNSMRDFRHDGFSPMPKVTSIRFRLDRDGLEFTMPPMAREVETAGRTPDYLLTGYPMKLGWALTIHKAQGMSVHHSWVDMSTILHHPEDSRHGLAYVALSRARTLEGLLISEWVPEAVQCHEAVKPLL